LAALIVASIRGRPPIPKPRSITTLLGWNTSPGLRQRARPAV